MGIVIEDILAKDIHITLTIPLRELISIEKCINLSTVDLPDEDEDFIYFKEEFQPSLESIIKKGGA